MEDFGSTKRLMQSENNMARQGSEDILSAKSPSVEREERLKLFKEKQNEERQKKLEELKAQTLEAQKFREQKEEERKRRMEDLRVKEMDKKQQVDERKKAIMVAERERIEFIMQKNQERDSRMENKKRSNRSSISFAFGSSTPRLLDPVDCVSISPSSFWSHRRSTSITNVDFSGAQVSRRSSEREFSEAPKKRATSAGGINRQNEDDTTESPAPVPYRSVARRKTDLMPTIPSPRDSYFGSRSSLCHTPRTPGKSPSANSPATRRAVSMTRLDQLAQPTRRNGEHIRSVIEKQRQTDSTIMSNSFSAQSNSHYTINTTITASANSTANTRNMSRSTTHLAENNSTQNEKNLSANTPLHNTDRSKCLTANISLTGSRSGDVTPGSSRPGSAMNTSMTMSGVVHRRGNTTPRKPRPASIACTGIKVESNDIPKDSKRDKPPIHTKAPSSARKPNNFNGSTPSKPPVKLPETPKPTEKRLSTVKKITNTKTNVPKVDMEKSVEIENLAVDDKSANETKLPVQDLLKNKQEDKIETENKMQTNNSDRNMVTQVEVKDEMQISQEIMSDAAEVVAKLDEASEACVETIEQFENIDMSASMTAKRITTEEEAKAALAERRRLAREEAERLAEMERMRLENERLSELERIAEEERQQKFLEEESLRLAEEQRKAEEKRLLQAIEDAKQREEEERLRREEEERQKYEKEENERKAREEAEKQKNEVAERLKREEIERLERRKRVETIMSRTRAKSGGNTPNKSNGKEENDVTKKVSPTNSDINLAKHDDVPTTIGIPNNTSGDIIDYEKSVTEKENSLINSFRNLMENNKNINDTNNSQSFKMNGKVNFETSIDDKSLLKCAIPDENNHSTSHNVVDNKIDSSVGGIYSFIEIDNKTQDSLADQLINMNIGLNENTDSVNFNNNSLLTNATLVTPGSHDNNKEISLL